MGKNNNSFEIAKNRGRIQIREFLIPIIRHRAANEKRLLTPDEDWEIKSYQDEIRRCTIRIAVLSSE